MATTEKQRRRNVEFHKRLTKGDPDAPDGSALHHFVYAVPSSACTIDGRGEFRFRLNPESDCYHRLVRAICNYLPESCDADADVLSRVTLEEVEAALEAEGIFGNGGDAVMERLRALVERRKHGK